MTGATDTSCCLTAGVKQARLSVRNVGNQANTRRARMAVPSKQDFTPSEFRDSLTIFGRLATESPFEQLLVGNSIR
jgi:hypothetical protein